MSKTFFKENRNGYDKGQVDRYIRKLIKEYQKTYKDYLETYDKYCALMGVGKKQNFV